MPISKVQDGVAIGLPLAVVLVWLVGLTGTEVPAEVATALGSIISGLIGYFMPERRADIKTRG